MRDGEERRGERESLKIFERKLRLSPSVLLCLCMFYAGSLNTPAGFLVFTSLISSSSSSSSFFRFNLFMYVFVI